MTQSDKQKARLISNKLDLNNLSYISKEVVERNMKYYEFGPCKIIQPLINLLTNKENKQEESK